jgi:hydroxypyruvate isomerase
MNAVVSGDFADRSLTLLDNTQELNWPAVCSAIVATRFKGYLAHEFVPARDPLVSLRQAVALCDI